MLVKIPNASNWLHAVCIRVPLPGGDGSTGSGFFIEGGYVVTAGHVAEDVSASLKANEKPLVYPGLNGAFTSISPLEVEQVRYYNFNPHLDIGLLKIKMPGNLSIAHRELQTVASAQIKEGDPVYITGHLPIKKPAEGAELTLLSGPLLSAKGFDKICAVGDLGMSQADVDFSGMSGSAVTLEDDPSAAAVGVFVSQAPTSNPKDVAASVSVRLGVMLFTPGTLKQFDEWKQEMS